MSDPIIEAIVSARVAMLLHQPFYGSIATNLKIVDASKWCKTAATDGRHFYYNREFIKSLTKEELIFLFAHEVWHLCFEHFGRRGDRDPQLYNMANDYIINYTLVKDRVGKMPPCGLYNEKYTNEMTSEEVYEILLKNSTEVQFGFDEHLELQPKSNGNNKSDDNSVTVTVMGEDGPPTLTQDDIEKIRNDLRNSIMHASQMAGGNCPGALVRLINQFIDPILDWKVLLETHIISQISGDFSFTRPNRRNPSLDVILPGRVKLPTIEVDCAIDVSGSISDEMIKEFLSEVKGIIDSYGDFKLRLWSFDTKVYNMEEFTGDNADDIYNYKVEGSSGGTLFHVNFDWMKKNDIVPKRLVIFTDGYPNDDDWGGGEDYCDTLFIINGSTTIVPPYGTHAYYIPTDNAKSGS